MAKIFLGFWGRKSVENWQFSGKFGRILHWKMSISVCKALLHLGILRLITRKTPNCILNIDYLCREFPYA